MLRNGLMGRVSRPNAICSGENSFILDVLEKMREAMPVSYMCYQVLFGASQPLA